MKSKKQASTPPPLPDDPEYLKKLIHAMEMAAKRKRTFRDRVDRVIAKVKGEDDIREGVVDKLLQVLQRKKKTEEPKRAPRVSAEMTPEMQRKYLEAKMRQYGMVREDLIEAIVAVIAEEDARSNVLRSRVIRAKKKSVDPTERGFMKKQMMQKMRQGRSRSDIKRDYKMLRAKGQV